MAREFQKFTAVLLAMLPMAVNAAGPVPVLGPDGHYYVAIPANAIN
jgi:hypothetical protein